MTKYQMLLDTLKTEADLAIAYIEQGKPTYARAKLVVISDALTKMLGRDSDMTIGEAVEALKEGKTVPSASGRCVSRASWPSGAMFERSDDGRFFIRTRDGLEMPYTPSDEDWAAEDWKLGGPTT